MADVPLMAHTILCLKKIRKKKLNELGRQKIRKLYSLLVEKVGSGCLRLERKRKSLIALGS